MVPVEVKVVQLPEEKPVEEKTKQKKEARNEAVNEPRLIPYEKHVEFNNMMFKKLFS